MFFRSLRLRAHAPPPPRYVAHWQCRATAFADGDQASSYDLVVDVTPRLDGSWFEVVVTREGWSGTKMLFEDEQPDRPAAHAGPLRAIFEKLGDTRYAHTNQEKHGETWRTTFTKTCHKG